jgi:peptidoglycan-N-acetylglucosamine deacetylase
MENERILANLNLTEALIEQFAGQSHKLFRPTWGKISKEQIQYLQAHGFKIVAWNADSFDHNLDNTVDNLVNNVLEQLRPNKNNIVLFHDADYTHTESRMNTVKALTLVIEQLKVRHYSFTLIEP